MFSQIKPKQIEPDTLTRMFMMTDTFTEIDTQFIEFKYHSIDSIVQQIVIDTLGLTSVWESDGFNALMQVSENDNLLLGLEAGKVTTGLYNVFGGRKAGWSNTTGTYNTALGFESLYSNTTESYNVAIGYQSARQSTAGHSNNFIGYRAGYNNTGNYNNFIGREAGYNVTSGTGNFYQGYRTGYLHKTGSYNLAIGYEANYGQTNGNATGVVALGFRAGYANNGSYNTFLGYEAGRLNTTGASNIGIGRSAMYSNTTANYVIALGNEALYYNTGTYNLAFGYRTLYGQSGLSTGSYNTAFGSEAGLDLTTGQFNILFGHQAGKSLTSNSGNYFAGYQAGLFQTSSYNNFLGYQAGKGLTGQSTGAYNAGIGYLSLTNMTTATGTVAIGRNTGQNISTAVGNILLGDRTGNTLTTGGYNVGIGYLSLYNNSTGTNNVGIGSHTGYSTTGSGNLFLGYQAGYNELGSNTLYIDNSSTTSPLIYGDFTANDIKINGDLRVTGAFGDSSGDEGSSGQLLSSTVTGTNWITPSYLTSEVDGSTTNELQTLSLSGERITLSNSGGNFDKHTITTSDAEGTKVAIVRGGLFPATSDVIVGEIDFQYSSENATSLAGADNDGELAEVTIGSGLSLSSGTLTATDASVLNEIQALSFAASTGTISLTSGGSVVMPLKEVSNVIKPTTSTDAIQITGNLLDTSGDGGGSLDIFSSTITGTDWKTASSLGLVETTNKGIDRPLAYFYQTTNQTTTTTKYIDIPTVSGSNYYIADGCTVSTASDYITCPTSGYYRIDFKLLNYSTSTASLTLYINGSSVPESTIGLEGGGFGGESVSSSVIVNYTASQQIKFLLSSSNGDVDNFYASVTFIKS